MNTKNNEQGSADLSGLTPAWQSMNTAPTDGTEIIIRFPKQGNVKSLAHYNTVHSHWSSKGDPIWPVEQGCEWAAIPGEVLATVDRDALIEQYRAQAAIRALKAKAASEPEAAPAAPMMCATCGADRLKSPCPNTQNCGMIGHATATPSEAAPAAPVVGRTNAEIVTQTEELAAELAKFDGFTFEGSAIRISSSPRAIRYWKMACIAQEVLTSTDPMDAASALEDTTPATSDSEKAEAVPLIRAHATFPERDTSKPAEQQGMFRKFDVRRVDGSDQYGGKHHNCCYFVLDLNHDKHAPAAMRAYAAACKATHPQLAADIEAEYGAAPAPLVDAAQAGIDTDHSDIDATMAARTQVDDSQPVVGGATVHPTVQQQIERLRAKWPQAHAQAGEHGAHLIVVPSVLLPTGWSVSICTLLFVAPIGFPGAAPEGFWVDAPDLKFNGEQHRWSSASNSIPGFPDWQNLTRFKWHLQAWSPNRDTLLTVANAILQSMVKHKSTSQEADDSQKSGRRVQMPTVQAGVGASRAAQKGEQK